jgi:hypothetical protein
MMPRRLVRPDEIPELGDGDRPQLPDYVEIEKPYGSEYYQPIFLKHFGPVTGPINVIKSGEVPHDGRWYRVSIAGKRYWARYSPIGSLPAFEISSRPPLSVALPWVGLFLGVLLWILVFSL